MSRHNGPLWSSTGHPRPPDDAPLQSSDGRENLVVEHSAEEDVPLLIHVMDSFRGTQSPPRSLSPGSRSYISDRPPSRPRTPPSPSSSLIPPTSIHRPAETTSIDLRNLEYVGSFDQNLMCPICHCPFVAPVKLDCDHFFCQECVNRALSHQSRESRSCPSCRRSTNGKTAVAVPKLINRILDELTVRCPLHAEGCSEVIRRGMVQDHVNLYCEYTKVDCPSEACLMKVRRKDSGKSWCQHALVACEDCQEEYMERDLQDHRSKQCNRRETSCPNCSTQLLYRELEGHLNLCPEATFPCTAALYGCDFISKREPLDQHQATCPIRKLVPFLEIQKLRLEDHEATLQHIRRKNSLLETSFANIQEVLGSSTSLDDPPPSSLSISTAPAPFDSTAAHLISLHESLREEVERVKAAVSELDAKASMMVMNESLRIKEDMAHMNAALSNTRMQVQWLMSSRLQNQQRAAMNRTQSSGEGGVSVLVGAASSSSAAGTGSGTGTGTAMLGQPVRRLSDSTRQETKL